MTQGIGARVQRKEDARHLHGRGNFVSDMILAGQSEVAFLRSPIAHGRIRRIVKPSGSDNQVFIRADLGDVAAIVAPATVPGYKLSEWHPLAHEKVRFVGEAIAMCVAPTRAEAEDLSEQIEVEFDELPVLIDAQAARMESTVRVHEQWNDNVFLTLNYESGFEAKAKGAPVVIRREIALARQAMVPMEGKAVLARWDDRTDQLLVYASTQVPHIIRVGLAQFLGIDQGRVRVISPDVGGGFGYKCILQPEELCVAWLALKFRQPFRYVEDRREHLVVGANSRQHQYRLTAHADERGRLLALDADITIDGGAYSAWPFTVALEPGQATGNLPGPYDFRGYRCHDNLVSAADMPYDNVARKHYDSGDYRKALILAREKIGLDAWRERQRRGERDGRLIGVGFASYCEQTAHGTSVFSGWGLPIIPGYDQATVRVTPDGGLEVRAGVHSHGQGMETTLAQIAHEVTGIELANIRVLLGDTGTTPYSTGTYASRSIVMAGGAVANACKALIPRFLAIGAHLMQAAVGTMKYENGQIIGPRKSVSLRDVAEAWYLRPQELPPDVDLGGLEATVGFRPKRDTGAFSYASHAAVVAVDAEVGAVEILDYVIVEDCGTLVNPMVVEGQTLGGAAQGIGTALYEESPFDPNGQPLASTFADYLLPGPTEIPAIRIHHMQTPSPYTEFGIKGMGEGGAIAPPAVIFNAVNDALRSLGVELTETPLTPRRLLEAIDRAKSSTQPRVENS